MDNTTLLEDYILSKDKEEFLNSITSHPQYQKLLMIHHIDNGKEEKLPKHRKNLFHKDNYSIYRLRKVLRDLEKETDEKKRGKMLNELNKKFFNFTFKRKRPKGAKVEKKEDMQEESGEKQEEWQLSKSGKNFGNIEHFIEKLYKIKKDDSSQGDQLLSKIGKHNYRKIKIRKVSCPSTQYRILRDISDYHHIKNIGSLFSSVFSKYKRVYEGNLYLSMNEYEKMTLKQIEDVSSSLGTQESMDVHIRRFEIEFYDYYTKIEKTENEEKLHGLFLKFKKLCEKKKKNFAKTGLLTSVGNFLTGRWDPYLGAFNRLLNKCLLINTYRRGRINKEYFKEFLLKPVDQAFWNYTTEKNGKKFYKNFSRVNHSWKKFVYGYDEKYSDQNLMEKCLDELIVNKKAVKEWKNYLGVKKLEKRLAIYKVKNGGPMAGLKDHNIGSHLIQQMENSKKLLLSEKNLSNFENKKCELSILVKNIKQVEVKVYEFDGLRYLKENNKEPTVNIDLDGLNPKNTNYFVYNEPKQQEHTEVFKFPEIDKKKRGFFIVDFVGEGMMSRAIIKKGSLNLMHQPYEHGICYYILDEKKEICKGENTGIFVKKKMIHCDSEGAIRIPYDRNNFDSNVILVHNEFACKGYISVPNESYSLKSQVIFNGEGILEGRRAVFILRNRLSLNNAPISIKKLENVLVTATLKTFDGISNTKKFEDVETKEDEDFSFGLVIPNKINSISIRITGKVETVARGKISLAWAKHIDINRNENTDNFITAFLSKSKNMGYQVIVRGKNGEPVKDTQFMVYLQRITDKQEHSEILSTNNHGIIDLGALVGIEAVKVSCYGNEAQMQRSLINRLINEKQDFNIPESFQICEGEDLVLPNLNLDLNKENFRLWKVTENRCFLEDCFSKIGKSGEEKIVIEELSDGIYELSYFHEWSKTRVDIYVHRAKRWKHSNLVIEKDFELRDVKSELNFLQIESINMDNKRIDKNTEIEVNLVSNDIENSVVHILGYHFQPRKMDLIFDNLKNVNTSPQEVVHSLGKSKNTFISERVLSDELSYIMKRQALEAPIGNTLPKPSILLHRKFIRETKEEDEVLNDGSDFKSNTKFEGVGTQSRNRPMKKLARRHEQNIGNGRNFSGGGYEKDYVLVNDFEYLKEAGASLVNLKPDRNGVVKFTLGELAHYSQLVIIAGDSFSHASKSLNLQRPKIEKIDLRLEEAKPAGLIYIEERYCSEAKEGREALITDKKNSQIAILENMNDLYNALLLLYKGFNNEGSTNYQKLIDWKFLGNWGLMSEKKKLKELNKNGGHELHVFCYFKDREFFDKNIRPMLGYKVEKNNIDYLLLGDIEWASQLVNVTKLQELTPSELLLLANLINSEGNPNQKQTLKRYLSGLKEKLELNPVDGVLKNRYDSILASKEAENGGAQNEMAQDDFFGCEEKKKRVYKQPKRHSRRKSISRSRKVHQLKVEEEEEKCLESESESSDCDGYGDEDEEDSYSDRSGPVTGKMKARHRKVEIQRYKDAGSAFEYGERHYNFGEDNRRQLNNFHLQTLDSILSNSQANISTEFFMLQCQNPQSIVETLSFSNLPFKSGKISIMAQGKDSIVQSSKPALVITKKIEEKSGEIQKLDLIVAQKFYDPKDKYSYDEEDPDIKTIKEAKEFLVGRIYEAQTSITNISENHLKLKLITQIPQGSMPVRNLDILGFTDTSIGPLQTRVYSFKFYFPEAGNYGCFPSTLMCDNKLASHAKVKETFKVVEAFVKGTKVMESLQDVLNYGGEEDILNYMEKKNIHDSKVFKISKIYWLLEEKEYYERVIKILKSHCFYDRIAWSYCFKHQDLELFQELALKTDVLRNNFTDYSYFKSAYLNIDKFKPLEYDPLINPRAHNIKDKKQNIRNKAFKETYEKFLTYCAEKEILDNREYVILSAYMALQDRVMEAKKVLRKVNENELRQDAEMEVQYDYLSAYLSIYTEFPRFETARKVSEKYKKFSDLSWRKRFLEICKQLREYDESTTIEDDELEEGKNIKHASNKELSDKAEYLKVEKFESDSFLSITYANIGEIKLKFFKLDAELLFTKDPFLGKTVGKFAFINPNHLEVLKVENKTGFENLNFEIPEKLQNCSLFISAQSQDKTVNLSVFEAKFDVQVIEDFGLLKVNLKKKHAELVNGNSKSLLLSKVYVKCYGRSKSGEVKFYKDGYTDFRGSFDYASLNSGSLKQIEKFSILVFSDDYGCRIVEAGVPSEVGRIVEL